MFVSAVLWIITIVNGSGRKDEIICKLIGKSGGGERGGVGDGVRHDGSVDVRIR